MLSLIFTLLPNNLQVIAKNIFLAKFKPGKHIFFIIIGISLRMF